MKMEHQTSNPGAPGFDVRPPALLSCTNLGKAIGARTILANITLAVPPDKIILITGRTGAGKSTLLSLLAGLDRPTAGQVEWNGTEISALPASQIARLRREHIGIVFQRFNLLPSCTAAQNIEAAMIRTNVSKADRRARAQQLLDQFGLASLADNLPAQLSVGQQQLVAVARALANNPRLLLADEPTGDVDPQTATQIIDALLSATRQAGRAMLITTHGSFPQDVADVVYRLEDGGLRPAQ